jgi:prevent-host-death family protein
MTKHWALQDAKARLSEVIRSAEKEPQHITVRGEEAAVVLSAEEYRRITGEISPEKKRTFYEIWKSAPKVPELRLPKRKREPMRKIEF